MFLFKLTDLKRVRSSAYELWEIDNDGLIEESVRRKILKILLTASFYMFFEIAASDGTTTSPSAKARKNCT